MGGDPKFFDACAGIGCFHLGMRAAGFDCVGAAEIDEGLQERYPKAFDLDPERMFGNVTDVTKGESWDGLRGSMEGAVMVAGFPCTPWSKSGSQTGKAHDEGMVFWGLLDLMDEIGSEAFVFENVPNLLGDSHADVWKGMRKEISDRGYHLGHAKISTKDVGIPQNRNRVFMVGRKAGGEATTSDYFSDQFDQIKSLGAEIEPLAEIIDVESPWGRTLSETHQKALGIWDQYMGWTLEDSGTMLELLPKPLWAMESWYRHKYEIPDLQAEIENADGEPLEKDQLIGCLVGDAALEAEGQEPDEIIESHLPPYYRKAAMGNGSVYPERAAFATRSRENMAYVESWLRKNKRTREWNKWQSELKKMKPSFQKFEYHLGRERPEETMGLSGQSSLARRFGKHLVQFRSSGIRVSRSNRFPTLVAIGQVPYTGTEVLRQPHWKTLARLQSIDESDIIANEPLFGKGTEPIKRLGNAVNVRIVSEIGSRLKPLLI